MHCVLSHQFLSIRDDVLAAIQPIQRLLGLPPSANNCDVDDLLGLSATKFVTFMADTVTPTNSCVFFIKLKEKKEHQPVKVRTA